MVYTVAFFEAGKEGYEIVKIGGKESKYEEMQDLIQDEEGVDRLPVRDVVTRKRDLAEGELMCYVGDSCAFNTELPGNFRAWRVAQILGFILGDIFFDLKCIPGNVVFARNNEKSLTKADEKRIQDAYDKYVNEMKR